MRTTAVRSAVAANAVGIGDREPRFVLRVGREIENAAREHVRRHDVDARLAVDALAMQAQQGQGWAPGALAAFAKRNGDAGVTVVVAFDPPLEAEIDERGRLDDELAGHDGVLLGPARLLRECRARVRGRQRGEKNDTQQRPHHRT